jgi:hypothetical protein
MSPSRGNLIADRRRVETNFFNSRAKIACIFGWSLVAGILQTRWIMGSRPAKAPATLACAKRILAYSMRAAGGACERSKALPPFQEIAQPFSAPGK